MARTKYHCELIEESLHKVGFGQPGWGGRHVEAWRKGERNHQGGGRLVQMIMALAGLADDVRTGSNGKARIGADQLLGPLWCSCAQNVRQMLDKTPTGDLDCGALDSLLIAMIKLEGFNIEKDGL